MNDTGQDVAVEAGPNGPENVRFYLIRSQTLAKNQHRIMIWTMHTVTTSVQLGKTTGGKQLPICQHRNLLFPSLLGSQCSASLNMGELMALPVKRNVLLIRFYSGILNQEAQVIDAEGRIHVLNRENTTGFEQWYAFRRSTIR